MAGRDVRRRRAGWAWLLLVGLLGLGAALGRGRAVPSRGADPGPAAAEEMPAALWDTPAPSLVPSPAVEVDSAAVADALRAFASHVAADGARERYAAMGLARLGIALGALVGREPGPDAGVVARANAYFRVANDLLTASDSGPVDPAALRDAARAGVAAMDALARARLPAGAALEDDLRQAGQAAEALGAADDPAERRREVRRFFEEAEDVLRRVAEAWPGAPGREPASAYREAARLRRMIASAISRVDSGEMEG
jgi:hypothetical protein